MLELVTLIAGPVYAYIGIVFLTNCSHELAEQGRQPGLATLVVSVMWPVTVLVVAVVFGMERRFPRAS
jgi:hypothetical protein